MNNPLLAPRIIPVFTPRRRRPRALPHMHLLADLDLVLQQHHQPALILTGLERRPARPREVVALVRGALAAIAAAASDLFGLG